MPKPSSKAPDRHFMLIPETSVPWQELREGERFGNRWRALANHAGAERIGVSIEELPPGKQSVPFHYHMNEEEHLYVLSGTASLRWGDETHTLKPGDYACFKAGDQRGHCLINNSTDVFRFIMIGEKNPHDVCVYPDSNKVKIRSTDTILSLDNPLEYWDGEKTG